MTRASTEQALDFLYNGRAQPLERFPRRRSWPRTAKIIRAWMVWVIVLEVLTLGLNAILLPIETVMSMLWPASIL
ncbi:GGDEF domain-containing protein, partial [Rhizobium ruizarguesonis]